MSYEDVQVQQEVDKIFTNADGFEDFANIRPAHKLRNDSEAYRQSYFSWNLKVANQILPEETYDKVAEAVAKDERVTKYLPMIALDAMGVSPTNPLLRSQEPTNPIVDKGGLLRGISKDELLKASVDTKHFDPVYRRALSYAADNFDKFRSFDENDAFIPVGDKNADNITTSDLSKADQLLTHYPKIPLEIAANRTILDNFSAIDANSSTKITHKETFNWFENNNPESKAYKALAESNDGYRGPRSFGMTSYLANALPKQLDDRQLGTSEKKSRDDYAQVIANLTAERNSTAAIFGWQTSK